ncbi:septation protein SepH [Microbacterium album]|nr:septation protein SepH [Microbacterium album]
MDQLTIVGTEDGRLVLATESGQRFTLAVDDVLRSEIRRARRDDTPAENRPPLPSPREIQAHIRSGLSAEEVAQLLGARIEDIRRFEGPVIAEREHIVAQALAVPVLMGVELGQDENPTFGVAIRAKLADLGARGERWTSWKESSGWIVKLEFTANDVDHDARWSFEPRRGALSPLNGDATQLSRQGPMPEGLIPRLRALDTVAPTEPTPAEEDRFDPAAFGPRRLPEPEPAPDSSPVARERATNRAPGAEVANPDTADLLEALRRRRGQREAPPTAEPGGSGSDTPAPATPVAPVTLFDAVERSASRQTSAEGQAERHADERPAGHAASDHPAGGSAEAREHEESPRRRGRTSMPSWDEIVFGARSDD